MTRLVIAAVVAAASFGVAGTASAECDPKARVCTDNCLVGLPDHENPVPVLFPPCPR